MPRSHVRQLAAPVLILAFLSAAARAQTAAELASEQYSVDPQHSTVAFSAGTIGGIHVRGRFPSYDAAIIFDPRHPERASVTAVIDAKSLTTDMSFRDDHLRSPDFFDVARYPTIVFVSDAVTPLRNGARVAGTLTMHGIARRIAFPAHLTFGPQASAGNLGRVSFSAELKLSRKDFGIAGTNKFNPDFNPLTSAIADTVDILLELTATRERYAGRTLGHGTPPGVADTVNRVLQANGVTAALATFRALRASQPNDFRFSAGQLDVIGHQLAERGAMGDAIQVLAFNAEQFGDVPGVLESLGIVRALANDAPGALDAYRRALARSPDSSTAREMVRRLEALTPSSR